MSVNRIGVESGLAVLLFLCGIQTYGQSPDKGTLNPATQSAESKPQNPPKNQQSIVVTAKLTPEEIEDGKINDVYQNVYKLQEQHNCAAAIGQYRGVVIPAAEKAKFDVPRNKFLFLAYRGIGDCDLSSGRFAEAEQVFEKLLEYVRIWPGVDDSDYAINYRSIGVARMGQQNWKGAEDTLLEAITILDQQIDRAVHSDSDFMRTEHANSLRMSQDVAMNLLGVVYFREQRTEDALAILDKAYNQAETYHATQTIVSRIVQSGVQISTAAGDSPATALWSQRSKSPN